MSKKRIDSIVWAVDEDLFRMKANTQEVVEVARRIAASAIFQLSQDADISVCELIEAFTADLQDAVKQLKEYYENEGKILN